MNDSFVKVRTLKSKMTWNQLHSEVVEVGGISVSLDTLKRLNRHPANASYGRVYTALSITYAVHFPDHYPLPAPLPSLSSLVMLTLEERALGDTFLSSSLQHQRDMAQYYAEHDEPLKRAGGHFLLAQLDFESILAVPASQREVVRSAAIDHLQATFQLLPDEPRFGYMKNRIEMNIGSALTIGKPKALLEEAKSDLRSDTYFDAIRGILEETPSHWVAAWNGVERASIIKDSAAVIEFFQRLVNIHPDFMDVTKPFGKFSSMSEDEAFEYAKGVIRS